MPKLKRLDPEGYYARLGIDPAASPADVAAAYRRQARVLHPDVPSTGNADAFVAVKQAYDVIGNIGRRADYDRLARRATENTAEPHVGLPRRRPPFPVPRALNLRSTNIPVAVWIGLVAILFLGIFEVARRLSVPPPAPKRTEIRPNAPVVPPQTPEAQRLLDYGPTPIRLAGTPNFYVVPAAGSTVLWRLDEPKKAFVPAGHLPPFSAVQVLRLFRQNGLVEVKVSDIANGFIEAGRLAPGDANAAHNAYCAYNAGPPPANGEVFRQIGSGTGRLALDNRTTQPAVVKLRDPLGSVVLTAYLAPNGHVDLDGLADGQYRPDFAIGEFWSRACESFAAGMRAQRLSGYFSLGALTPLTIPPDLPGEPPPIDISDETFHQD